MLLPRLYFTDFKCCAERVPFIIKNYDSYFSFFTIGSISLDKGLPISDIILTCIMSFSSAGESVSSQCRATISNIFQTKPPAAPSSVGQSPGFLLDVHV